MPTIGREPHYAITSITAEPTSEGRLLQRYAYWWGHAWRETNKKSASRKKPRLPQTVGHRVYQGRHIPTGWVLATTDPLRGSSLWLRYLQAALQASPSLAVFHNTPSRWQVCATIRPLRWRRRRRGWGYFVDFFVGRRGAFFVVARRADALDALASSATIARQSCRLSAFASLSLGIL